MLEIQVSCSGRPLLTSLSPHVSNVLQAALEGALSALANIADLSSEAQQSAHRSGLLEVLVGCLQQATNGAAQTLPLLTFNVPPCCFPIS